MLNNSTVAFLFKYEKTIGKRKSPPKRGQIMYKIRNPNQQVRRERPYLLQIHRYNPYKLSS